MSELTGVKVGDILHRWTGWGAGELVRVARLTEKQAVTEGGERYWLKDGRAVGASGFRSASVSIAKPEDFAAIRRERLTRRILSLGAKDLERIPLERLEAIWKELDPKTAERSEATPND